MLFKLLLLGCFIALVLVMIRLEKASNKTMKVKSQFTSLVFTSTFGPFGLCYSNTIAAILMLVIWLISAFIVVDKLSYMNSLPDLIQYGGGYIIWASLVYIATIIIGVFSVIKYNDNFAIDLEALIDKKIAMRDMNTAFNPAVDTVNNDETVTSDDVNAKKVFCSKCGKENKSDAKFCTSCGSSIATSE